MKSFVAIAALAAIASAIPHAKRDVVWVTTMEIVTETVDVTKTVWVDAADATESPVTPAQEKYVPQAQGPHNHANHHKSQPQTTMSTVAVPSTPSTTPVTTPSPTPVTTQQPVITSTTSVYIAPSPKTTPQTTAAPSPAPVQSSAAPVSQSSAPEAYSPPASGNSGSGSSSGGGNGCSGTSGTCNSAKFTYYTPGMGSCGETNTDSDYIFAYGASEMQAAGGANPNKNPLCGRKISIKAHDGTDVTATLVDTCQACSGNGGMLDLSTGLWNRIAKGSDASGVLNDMEFTWL